MLFIHYHASPRSIIKLINNLKNAAFTENYNTNECQAEKHSPNIQSLDPFHTLRYPRIFFSISACDGDIFSGTLGFAAGSIG